VVGLGRGLIDCFFPRMKEDFSNILDYKVEAKTGMGKLAGFPKTYSAFQEKSVYLYSPKEGNLKSGTIQLFKLKVLGAESVIVINAGKWFFLKTR